MWKNYMLAALNVAVAGLPFLVGWDLVLYGVYCGFAVLLLGLTAWNPVGIGSQSCSYSMQKLCRRRH